MHRCDFLVVGGGMAGASVAYYLSEQASVTLVEMETQPGYHTTGRSAALFSETYGNATIRGLTSAGRDFYENPPPGFVDHPLLTPRGALFIAREDQRKALENLLNEVADETRMTAISRAAARALVPVLEGDYVAVAAHEPGAMDIDVHTLHQGYLKGLRRRGGTMLTDAAVGAMRRRAGRWHVETGAGAIEAAQVINAAGAWCDQLAVRAGARPIGLVAKRRTAFTFDPPTGVDIATWPLVVDVDERFYFKPDAGRLLGSPADETPSPPVDAQPEEMDVAVGVDRIERASTLRIRRIVHKWAGLRSFVVDKTPVAGYDDAVEGFFWLAGQGGYGIQTAPGLGRTAAALAMGAPVPADIARHGVTAAALSPNRLARAPAA